MTTTTEPPLIDAEQLGSEILRALRSNPTRGHWRRYEAAKREFVTRCPGASPAQYEHFVELLTRALNL